MRLSTGMVWDVLPAFQLRDERMRGAGALGDLLLGQIQLASLVSHENEPSGQRLRKWTSLDVCILLVTTVHSPSIGTVGDSERVAVNLDGAVAGR
jgi:hypothetical protein